MDATLTTADGLKLHLREWPLAPAHGTVLIVHGLGEHIGRYVHVAMQLNAWGWRVAGFDHRGHGRSDGARGRLASADDLLRDLAQVIDAVRSAHPDGPLLLLGHSMGGAVAARFVAEGLAPSAAAWHRPVDALVLSSPALALDTSAVQKLLLALVGPLAPNLSLGNGLNPAWVSRDPAVVKAYIADPLNHDRISPRLARFMLDAGAFVRSHAGAWKLPTLLLYAGSDRCVAPAGSGEFSAAAPRAVVTTQEFRPLYHEIFNEPEQREVFDALSAWLQRFSARPES